MLCAAYRIKLNFARAAIDIVGGTCDVIAHETKHCPTCPACPVEPVAVSNVRIYEYGGAGRARPTSLACFIAT